jgi:uncharacterized BrkB/YihY/UPF0761 family membrane protein
LLLILTACGQSSHAEKLTGNTETPRAQLSIGYSLLYKSAFSSVYGAAGALLVLLLWTYYSAQIFLFGAEITKSYSSICGMRTASVSTGMLDGPGFGSNRRASRTAAHRQL